VIETLSLKMKRSPLSSMRICGARQLVPFQVVTEMAEIPSAAESIGCPMKYRLPASS
jgi:hypothetical protein